MLKNETRDKIKERMMLLGKKLVFISIFFCWIPAVAYAMDWSKINWGQDHFKLSNTIQSLECLRQYKPKVELIHEGFLIIRGEKSWNGKKHWWISIEGAGGNFLIDSLMEYSKNKEKIPIKYMYNPKDKEGYFSYIREPELPFVNTFTYKGPLYLLE